MSTLCLVAAVSVIDLAAKALGKSTISEELRANKGEAAIGVVWLVFHIFRKGSGVRP